MATKKNSSATETGSVEEKLKNLFKLQTLLSEIDKIRTLRGELPLEVEDLEDEIEGLVHRLENTDEDVRAALDDVALRRTTIDKAQGLTERYKAQINDVRNNREYDVLSKEIEFQSLEIELQTKKIREAQQFIDDRRHMLEETRATLDDRRAALEVKKSELDEIVTETQAEEERLRQRAKDLEYTIDPRLLAAFKRIRKNSRNGLGIVYIQRDACGGCFNKIPPQRQLDIRMRKKIIVCEYCGRIIIDPELAGVEELHTPVPEKPKRRTRAAAKKAVSDDAAQQA